MLMVFCLHQRFVNILERLESCVSELLFSTSTTHITFRSTPFTFHSLHSRDLDVGKHLVVDLLIRFLWGATLSCLHKNCVYLFSFIGFVFFGSKYYLVYN